MSLPSRIPRLLRLLLLTLALLGVGAAGTGCGLFDRSVEEQIEDFEYDGAGARDGFMAGCTSRPQADDVTCGKVFACLEKHVPVEKLRDIALRFYRDNTTPAAAQVGKKAQLCLREAYRDNPMASGGYDNPQVRASFEAECLKASGAQQATDPSLAAEGCDAYFECVRDTVDFADFYELDSALTLGEKVDKRTRRQVTRCANDAYTANPAALGGYDNPVVGRTFRKACVKASGEDLPGVEESCAAFFECVRTEIAFEDYVRYESGALDPATEARLDEILGRCATRAFA